jgi:riboflavin kinase
LQSNLSWTDSVADRNMDKSEASSLSGSLLLTLCRLAELAIPSGEVSCTTSELAVRLSRSQQTASRHLIELERMGLIKRVRVAEHQSIRLTSKGLDLLKEIYFALKRIFERPKNEIYLEGELFSGLGEGSYYIGQEGYRKQVKEKLGFDPYPGTLNIRLKPSYESATTVLEDLSLVPIMGFRAEGRSFGPAKCARALINDSAEAAIVLALRSHYGADVVEIIAGENLRKRLRLREGDTVRVRVLTLTPQLSSS